MTRRTRTHLVLDMSTSSASTFSAHRPDHPKRRPLRAAGLALAILSFQTLGMTLSHQLSYVMLTVTHARTGIIYSDIGTSPLYVLNGIWSSSGPVPPKDDVIGCISAIIWSLTLLPFCKYVSHPLPSLCTDPSNTMRDVGSYLLALWHS